MDREQLCVPIPFFTHQSVTGKTGYRRVHTRHAQCQCKNHSLLYGKRIILFFRILIQKRLQLLFKMLTVHHGICLLFLLRQSITSGLFQKLCLCLCQISTRMLILKELFHIIRKRRYIQRLSTVQFFPIINEQSQL